MAIINGTDGIVYVHHEQCGRNVLACLLLSVTRVACWSVARLEPTGWIHDSGPVEWGKSTEPPIRRWDGKWPSKFCRLH